MVTKNDVRAWLYKCQQKAVASVSDKGQEDFMVLVRANEKLAPIVALADKMVSVQGELEAMMVSMGVEGAVVSIGVGGTQYVPYPSCGLDIAKILMRVVYLNKETFKAENSVLDSANKKRNELSSEYHTLITKCDSLKAHKAVEYLETLGFDVSTIDRPDRSIDRSKLFVCGDNKPG